MATQAQLGKNLIAALQRGGTEEAIPFCNLKALPLTDSIAVASKSKIQRVTDRPRNPLNSANEAEIRIISNYQKLLAEDKQLEPVVIEKEEANIHYFPILTNAMCLQCHGKPESDMQSVTLEQLKAYYPQDKALGYGPNEVRGLWKVTPGSQNP
ncbi:MAG: DUF3365 domain-containing protein [Eudoraea sp.]|nr:DUF3365 domain-containing protein [Eudoraea sp.]